MRSPPALLLAALAALAGSAPGPAAAGDPPLPPTAADVEGARSLALSAYRGLAGGNEGLFLNAASMSAKPRYELELQFAQERLGSARVGQWFTASVVDSTSGGLAGGLAFTRLVDGVATGNLWTVAASAPMSGSLFAGLTGKFLDVTTRDEAALWPVPGRGPGGRTRAVTMDASLFWKASQLVGFGVSGYNLVPVADALNAPMGFGLGLAAGDERRFNVLADWRADFDRRGHRSYAFGAGAEIFAMDAVPVRASFLKDGIHASSYWAAGLGVVSASGVALDFSYRQSIDHPDDRTFASAIKIFIMQ